MLGALAKGAVTGIDIISMQPFWEENPRAPVFKKHVLAFQFPSFTPIMDELPPGSPRSGLSPVTQPVPSPLFSPLAQPSLKGKLPLTLCVSLMPPS